MKRTSLIFALLALSALLAQAQQPTQPTIRAYDRINWTDIFQVRSRMTSPKDQNDMEQIQARLTLATACKLPADDQEIALARAQKPSLKFGMTNFEGMRWLVSAQVVAEDEKCRRMKLQDEQIKTLQGQLNDLKDTLDKFRNALEVLTKPK